MNNRILYILLLFCLFCTRISAIDVVFRLDDPTLQCDSVSLRAVELFHEKQVPLSIAVIPCDNNEQPVLPVTTADSLYWSKLQDENIELTLHGLNHQDINNQGEFGGLSYTESRRRMRTGGGVLQRCVSQRVITFIPPFNAFNDSTLVAMMDNGLFILSADMFSNIYRAGIQYYPETLGHLMQQKGIWCATEDAIFNSKEKDAICVVMFHAYDLPDEASWKRLSQLLDACKADKNVQLHTFQSLYESGNLSSQYRYRANQLHSGLQKYCLNKGVLHTTWLCWSVHILNALVYALLPLLLLIGWGRQRKPMWLVATLCGSVLFAVLALSQMVGPIKLLALDGLYVIVASVGLCIISKVRSKK